MIAAEIALSDYITLNPENTIREAEELFASLHTDLIPVVSNDDTIYGYYSKSFATNSNKKIKDILSFYPQFIKVVENQHVFEIVALFQKTKMSLVAVENSLGKYIGVITWHKLLQEIASYGSFENYGALLVIELMPKDYSLSELSRLVEYNNTKILGVEIKSLPDKTEIEVCLKLNHGNISNILATLERYNYKVKDYFLREDITDDLDDRYKSFMKYLNI